MIYSSGIQLPIWKFSLNHFFLNVFMLRNSELWSSDVSYISKGALVYPKLENDGLIS
jgi:hypothetical protein